MRVEKTGLIGVLKIIPNIFEDHRGIYVESYNREVYNDAAIDVDFIQDDHSISERNVLRGLHGDEKTWKLVMCPVGEILLAVVNCDKNSPEYFKWETFVISRENQNQILIPPKFANGHLVLSDFAMFSYKQSTSYEPESQFTYAWDDPRFGIDWPVKTPILSGRDSDVPEKCKHEGLR